MAIVPKSSKLTDEEMSLFCAELARTDSVTIACRNSGIKYARYTYQAKVNKEFREAIDYAKRLFKEGVVETLRRRAIEGEEVAKWYDARRERVVEVKEFDNKLLLELVRVVDPRFTQKAQDGTSEKLELFQSMSAEQRERLLKQAENSDPVLIEEGGEGE